MITESPVQIDFAPTGGARIVLLERGGLLVSFPRMDTAQSLHEADGILAATSHFKALGGARVRVSWEQESAAMDTHWEAQGGFLNAEREGLAELLEGAGVLAFRGEKVTSYPGAIASIRPGLPYGPESVRTRRFEVVAGLPSITINRSWAPSRT